MANWFSLDTFRSESDEQEDAGRVIPRNGRDPFRFDESNYERDVARNTFLNRFECDPALTPYDTEMGSRRVSGSVSLPTFKPTGEMATTTARSFYNPQFLRSDSASLKLVDSFAVKDLGVSKANSGDWARKPSHSGQIDRVLAHGEPVTAQQGGLVVYSSKRPGNGDGIDLNGHIVPVGDLSRYEGDVIVVQSWDDGVSGVRYHLYSGLDAASVVAGDRVKAGQQIGKGESSALRHELRKQTVHGPLVEFEARKGN